MAQYVYSMHRVSKVVPPKREILKDISLSFFPGAKIGVLGLNGAGKSTLLRIMAGVDTEFDGEARPMPGIKVGYLPQEPQLDPAKDVRGNVEDGVRECLDAMQRLDEVFADVELQAEEEQLALSELEKSGEDKRLPNERLLAERLGISRQAVGALERDPASASFERLMRVWAVLGLEISLQQRSPRENTSTSEW